MTPIKATLRSALLVVALLDCLASAQKVEVGFDKTVDFSKYRTYSWSLPEEPVPTDAPLRRAIIMSEIEDKLARKGLQRVDHSGDLILDVQGALGGEIGGQHQGVNLPSPSTVSNPMNTVWSGAPVAAGSYVQKGKLIVNFVDANTKSLVWEGSVATKLDHENKDKNLHHLQKAISKLLERFPPKGNGLQDRLSTPRHQGIRLMRNPAHSL